MRLGSLPCRRCQAGFFDLGIDADILPRRTVEAANELQFLGQRGHLKVPLPDGEPVRVDRLARLETDSLCDPERLDLVTRKIQRVIAAVVAPAIGEPCGHVRYRIEMDIMQNDRDVVGGKDAVLFEEIGPHGVGKRFGLQSVFGQVSTRPSMGDDNGPVLFRHGRASCCGLSVWVSGS